MLAPKPALSALMDDYLKFRVLHQGSSAGSVDQYERTYRSLLDSLPSDTVRALTAEVIERWVMRELERGVGPRTMSSRVEVGNGGAVLFARRGTDRPALSVGREVWTSCVMMIEDGKREVARAPRSAGAREESAPAGRLGAGARASGQARRVPGVQEDGRVEAGAAQSERPSGAPHEPARARLHVLGGVIALSKGSRNGRRHCCRWYDRKLWATRALSSGRTRRGTRSRDARRSLRAVRTATRRD